MKSIHVLLLSLICICSSYVQAQIRTNTLFSRYSDSGKKTQIKIHSGFDALPRSGFAPLKVEVINKSNVAKTFLLKSNSYSPYSYRSSEDSSVTAEFKFECPANETRVFEVMAPLMRDTRDASDYRNGYGENSELSLILNGDEIEKERITFNSANNDSPQFVLVSNHLFDRNPEGIGKALSTNYFSGSSTRPTTVYSHYIDNLAVRLHTQMAPTDWRAYVSVHYLMISKAEWVQMQKPARDAILRWVSFGGTLHVFSTDQVTGKELDITTTTSEFPCHYGSGTVEFTMLVAPNSSKAPKIQNVEALARSVLSKNTVITSEINDAFSSRSWPLQESFGQKSYNTGLFVTILIIFAIVVGPGSLIYLGRKNKRHLLFITIPVFSAIASALLIAGIFFIDGTGGKGKRIALVEIDTSGNTPIAMVSQEQFCRTGMIMGSDFSIEQDCYITEVPIAHSRWSRVNNTSYYDHDNLNRYEIAPRENSTEYSGDWFSSRSEFGHYLQSASPTRSKLSVSVKNETPSFSSTLDYTVKRALYLDTNEQWWVAEEIKPGASVQANRIPKDDANDWLETLYASCSSILKSQLENRVRRKGHYVALTHEAPGIDTLDSIDWQETTTIITGN